MDVVNSVKDNAIFRSVYIMFEFFIGALISLGIIASPAQHTEPKLYTLIIFKTNQAPIVHHVSTTGEGEHFVRLLENGIGVVDNRNILMKE
jgi:hypothetical protein